MRRHARLILIEREDIMLLRREGRNITEVAETIDRSKSTASRELRRSSHLGESESATFPLTYRFPLRMMRGDGYPGWNSPTGMVEFTSSYLEDFGEDSLPYFKECLYAPTPDAPLYDPKYPLSLTTGMRKYTSFHSEHRMIKSLREIDPTAWCEINPKTAEEHGITDGGWVTIENMFGKCNMQAHVQANIKEGVVVASHGWWFPE